MPITLNGLPQPIPKPAQPDDEQIASPDVHPDMAPLPTIGEGLKRYAMPSLAPDPRRDELAALRAKDEQTLDKIQNHSRLGNVIPITPGEGTGHSVLRGIEHVGRGLLNVGQFAGNAFGNLFAPGLMAMTPGTDLHNAIQRNKAETQLKDIAKEERDTQNDITKQGLETAQTREEGAKATEEEARANALENPKDTDKPDKFSIVQTDQGLMRVDQTTGEATPVQAGGKTLGRPDAPDQFVYQQTDHGLMRINKQTGQAEPVQFNGQPLKPFEKPPVVNVNAANTRADKNYQFESKRVDAFGKPIEDMAGRFGRLVDTVNQRTPQADALIAPELLTVMAGGQGSGLRMNEAEIARIVGGRTNAESLKAALNKWQLDPSKGLSVTEPQRQQIQALIQTVNTKLQQKLQVLDAARQALVNTDDPHEMKRITADTHKKLTDIDNGGAAQEPQRPANVPEGYKFNANGPKGAGWYKP